MSQTTRFATVLGARDSAQVEAYLPSNYRVVTVSPKGTVLIAGEDAAGWTLEDYIIPRLGSGLMGCREVAVSPKALAYGCEECGRLWTVYEDADDWAYGHDCEV